MLRGGGGATGEGGGLLTGRLEDQEVQAPGKASSPQEYKAFTVNPP